MINNIINKKLEYKTLFFTIKFCCIIILFICFFSFVGAASTDVPISLTINPWQITVWSPTYMDLWQINLSTNQQNIQWQFSDYFWAQDLEASINGYSTTIVSDGLVWLNWITLTWIYIMAWNNWSPELLVWNTWNVQINSVFSGDYYSIFNTPVTYIYRSLWAVYSINKYGDRPFIRVVIPGYVQPWKYSWVIYFDI